MNYISKIVLYQSGKHFSSNYKKAVAMQNMYYISFSKIVLNQSGKFFASNHKKSTSRAEPCSYAQRKLETEKMVINFIFYNKGHRMHSRKGSDWFPVLLIKPLYIHTTKGTSVLRIFNKILKLFSSWVELICLSQWDKWVLLLKKKKITCSCFLHHKEALTSHSHSSDASFLIKRCWFFNSIVLLEKLIFSSQSLFY